MKRRRPWFPVDEKHIVTLTPPARLVGVQVKTTADILSPAPGIKNNIVVFSGGVQPVCNTCGVQTHRLILFNNQLAVQDAWNRARSGVVHEANLIIDVEIKKACLICVIGYGDFAPVGMAWGTSSSGLIGTWRQRTEICTSSMTQPEEISQWT
jgi:hypothetical protein